MLLNPGPGCVVGSWEFHCECLQCQLAWVVGSVLAGWAGGLGVGKHLIRVLGVAALRFEYVLILPFFNVRLFFQLWTFKILLVRQLLSFDLGWLGR